MKSLIVNLPSQSYPIEWDNDINSLARKIQEKTLSGRHFVITNGTLLPLYKNEIKQIFAEKPVLVIPDGESFKNYSTITNLADQLLELGANRKSTLWAFGGGVVGDITGFLASIYMRGIDFYQVPTTLLSMVDSSVGGKTGVNLEHGKNMLGTFYQPKAVFIHVNFLKTLAAREFKSGMSEVIKSALLGDPDLFSYIENHINQLNDHIEKVKETANEIHIGNSFPDFAMHESLMEEISFRSVSLKARVVTEDEKETGVRAILNLGHTLAHALESYYNYTGIKHGEAVSMGIVFAALLSRSKGYLSPEIFERIQNLFSKLNMFGKWEDLDIVYKNTIGVLHTHPSPEDLIHLMKGDKKNTDEAIRFILLKGIAEYTLPEPVDIPTIRKTLEEFICL